LSRQTAKLKNERRGVSGRRGLGALLGCDRAVCERDARDGGEGAAK